MLADNNVIKTCAVLHVATQPLLKFYFIYMQNQVASYKFNILLLYALLFYKFDISYYCYDCVLVCMHAN